MRNLQPVEEFNSFRARPRLAVKPFDHPAEKFAAHVKMASATRINRTPRLTKAKLMAPISCLFRGGGSVRQAGRAHNAQVRMKSARQRVSATRRRSARALHWFKIFDSKINN